ncbi:hypothetical protein GPB2148_1346 [marine gamma proteobacterium HTCC2148]|nr:hypothetical protein GPB2148_1346 [marine gamma proteobacterium HTCC2148]
MFFKKKKKGGQKLSDIVAKVNDTSYIFVDINNDLGEASEAIMSGTTMAQMEYGYARRTAAAALYVQGLIDKENYDHAVSIFKSLQIKTEHSVEFQEAAFAGAVEFLLGYSHLVSSFMAKMIVSVAENYDIPQAKLDDGQLFQAVIETAHNQQETTPNTISQESAQSRIIEYVDQGSSSRLGPFADLMEDVKAASSQAEVMRTPLLSAAAGYTMELAVAGLWVAGGVHHKLIEDTIEGIFLFKADIGSDIELHKNAASQAVELASVYVPGITAEHIEVMVNMTKDLERLRKEGEPVLGAGEVLLRTA